MQQGEKNWIIIRKFITFLTFFLKSMHKEILSNEQIKLLPLKLPELIDLAAMKAYYLGRRSKWKDYVDIYFLLRDHFSVEQISVRASQIFERLFSPKLFRAQLSYFDDINYSEPIEFLVPAPSEEEIKQFLIDKAIEI